MKMTMAEVDRQEWEQKGVLRNQRALLIRVLHNRFGEPSKEVVKKIEAESDLAILNQWFDLSTTARTIKQVGIV